MTATDAGRVALRAAPLPGVHLHVPGPILALVAPIVVGALFNPNLLGGANLINVLARSAFIGIIAAGMTFLLTAGDIDLGVGSMAAFIAGLMILVMNLPVPSMGAGTAVILVGMAVALVAGLLNGVLITSMRIEAFIVTLGTMGIHRSLVTRIADGGTLSLDFAPREATQPISFGCLPGITCSILVPILGEVAMRRMAFGRCCVALGSNDQVACFLSMGVNRVRLMTYGGLEILVGIATVLSVPLLGSASSSTGISWEIEAIAAVIIGGTMLQGRPPARLGHGGGGADPGLHRRHPGPNRLGRPRPQRHHPGGHHRAGGDLQREGRPEG